ncbi:MAG: tRNA pseudouridine(55) synthase TruB [Burkholderiales bacterium]|nr:tRNA pseudouridine(55) synthase TruB [Burkholderiales bacterium]MDE2626673.1 tRNA pseudouridine(55) synthase TruB [Burkholderiales bacterium]
MVDVHDRPTPGEPKAGSSPSAGRAPRGALGAVVRRAVHGVLLLDKPLGLSSNDALQKAKRLYRAEKAGHTGTLDPLATGLLPLCFGAATKFSQISLDADKTYRATLRLGVTTTTADAEGEVLQQRDVGVSRAQVQAACERFVGAVHQVPPMHSALKHDGKPLYAYARAGIEVEREARTVTIHRIDIIEGDHDTWTLDVHCSKGTYIRTLAEDIGNALGCGAHLIALRRTGSGTLTLDGAHTLEQLAAMTEAQRDAALLPTDALIADWPMVHLGTDDAGRFLSGVRRRVPLADAPKVRVYGPAPPASPGGPEARVLLGSGHIAGGELISTRLLSPVEVQGLLSDQRSTSESNA